jgi:hypothetical protein
VTQKGPFDTQPLLWWGESLFPLELGSKVPEAIFDAKEAGKCLAYQLPSACGFHIFRAVESVLRKYYTHVTAGVAHPKVRALGVYVRALEAFNEKYEKNNPGKPAPADPKILASLDQMTKLHRNPLIHPEVALTDEEAIAIIGVARSAVGAMLTVLPVPPATTTTSLTAALASPLSTPSQAMP